MVCPKGSMEMEVPILNSIVDNLLKDFDKHFVGLFSLTITLRVRWGGPTMLDMIFLPKLLYILFFEWLTIVSDNGGGNSISIENMEKEELEI